MASVSDFVFDSTLAPCPSVSPNATLNSSTVGVVEFDIPKKYVSFVSVKDDETILAANNVVSQSRSMEGMDRRATN